MTEKSKSEIKLGTTVRLRVHSGEIIEGQVVRTMEGSLGSISVKPGSVWVHRAFLLICGLPSLYIASVIPLNKFTDWEYGHSIHLSPKVNSFVVDVQGGLANACLSFATPVELACILLGTLYLLVRFRRMTWPYRLAFVFSDLLAIIALYGVLDVLRRLGHM